MSECHYAVTDSFYYCIMDTIYRTSVHVCKNVKRRARRQRRIYDWNENEELQSVQRGA